MQRLLKISPYLCIALTLLFAIAPIERACFRQPLNYNEGWNIYNAIKFGQHQQLYPAHYAWTTNNYPMLSFVFLSALHKLTGDYLFTGRAVAQLSTILLCVLVYFLLKQLGATRWASLLGALFCFSFFAVNTASYIAFADYTNTDDPQMLGLMLFVAGLLLYVLSKRRQTHWLLLASAFVIALGLSVKHSPVDILVALLIDCLWSSWKRLLAFLAYLAPLIAASVFLQLHYGGPWFLRELLEKRVYRFHRATDTFSMLFAPVWPLLAIAVLFAVWRCRSTPRRIVLILILTTAPLDLYFGSAQGVSINAFFSLMVALSLSLGLFFSDMRQLPGAIPAAQLARLSPLAIFLFLLIPASFNSDLNPHAVYEDSKAAQADLDSEAAFMAQHPGPALCQDLLTCYLAGKPYLYDPFNTTRLIRLGHLDETALVRSIQHKQYSSIEIHRNEMDNAASNYSSERFTQNALFAIKNNYRLNYQRGEIRIFTPNP